MGDISADPAIHGFDESDLEAIRESLASVLAEQCGSLALHAHVDGKLDLDQALEAQGRELGWAAIGLSEELGGFGLGAHGIQLLHHQLGLVAAPGGFLASGAAAHVLAEHGTSGGATSEWLTRLSSGEVQAAIPAVLDEGLIRAANGTISGRTTLIGSPGAAIALVAVGQDEVALIELAGLVLTPLDFWDRTRNLAMLELDGHVPVTWLGKDGAAHRALMRAFALAVASDCIGVARGITDKTIAYMKERSQFGRVIGSFQALKHRAVDLVAVTNIAEFTLAQAIEAAPAADRTADMWARLAKAAASEAAVFVAGDCVQLHGGVGFTWEFDVHLYLKRARLNEMLVTSNLALRDAAAADLAAVTEAGASTLELATL
ncbi:acyl-CoA/acyl-ACP dehydrogenase [Novosphingobium sp. G106]|uniref:acyl-CoA dehydrogenase family protein n=1 Tax=Novosphingobium sp. G106 TaxID=2849500 RepID=UPI001C2D0528|nr:acyl-CoA dehydrogenase family protein [Novosphingobium sp. G106]MBV1688911.1 acyl-CoA/acyl-ACP dehydrogenase [Novosphingobium sp. G106]